MVLPAATIAAIKAGAIAGIGMDVIDAAAVVVIHDKMKQRKAHTMTKRHHNNQNVIDTTATETKETEMKQRNVVVHEDGSATMDFNDKRIHFTKDQYEAWLVEKTEENKVRKLHKVEESTKKATKSVGKAIVDTDLRDVGHAMRTSVKKTGDGLKKVGHRFSSWREETKKEAIAIRLSKLEEAEQAEVLDRSMKILAEKKAEEEAAAIEAAKKAEEKKSEDKTA